MTNEIIFGLITKPNPGLSHELEEELVARATDKRRKFQTAADEMVYFNSQAFQTKKKGICLECAEFGMISELGLEVVEDKTSKVHEFITDKDEKETIEAFWEFFAKQYDTLFQYGLNDPLVGYDILSWGMPFLLKRSIILGVKVPRTIPLRKENNPLIYDIAIHWEGSVHPGGDSLRAIAGALGIKWDHSGLIDELEVSGEVYKRMKGVL